VELHQLHKLFGTGEIISCAVMQKVADMYCVTTVMSLEMTF
jgi:hypothetical protein